MKITHFKKIKPGFFQVPVPYSKDKMTIYFVPTESTRYVQSVKSEQNDWLKATGISFSPILNSHKNSIMLGWRYNQKLDTFEFCAYCHDSDKNPHYPEKDKVPFLSSKINEPIKMVIEKINAPLSSILVRITNMVTEEEVAYTLVIKTSKWARTISPWFGGTLPPPRKVLYYMYINAKEEKIWKLVEALNRFKSVI